MDSNSNSSWLNLCQVLQIGWSQMMTKLNNVWDLLQKVYFLVFVDFFPFFFLNYSKCTINAQFNARNYIRWNHSTHSTCLIYFFNICIPFLISKLFLENRYFCFQIMVMDESKCPNCRKPLTTTDYHPVFFPQLLS